MKIIIIKFFYNQQSYYPILKLRVLTLRVHCEPINIAFGIQCILCVVSLMSTPMCVNTFINIRKCRGIHHKDNHNAQICCSKIITIEHLTHRVTLDKWF